MVESVVYNSAQQGVWMSPDAMCRVLVQVCKPSCKKITTTTTTTTQALSLGKGGQQVMMSYAGKGH